MSSLDMFIHHSHPTPTVLATSQEIRDRGSTFAASIYRATTPSSAQLAIHHLKHVVHASKPASHEIAAWRCMVLKQGKSGLGGPDDFEMREGWADDGEEAGGRRVLGVMKRESVIDAVVVVSRWYGGTMLGPARFTHIETLAYDVSRTFKRKEDVEECISTLSTLDDILADLRAQLVQLQSSAETTAQNDAQESHSGPPATSPASRAESIEVVLTKRDKKQDYSSLRTDLDLTKARRLVTARENAVKSVKTLIRKKAGG